MNFTMDTPGHATGLLFGWMDSCLFILMLVLSTLIGVYFGFWGKKEDSPHEYLLAGKSMSTVPVAVSLVASLISGITVMGDPAEVYTYGTLYWLGCLFAPIVGILNNYFYLPVFYELQITSVFEYLQLRFNRSVRVMASVLSTIGILFYIPIVMYVPALALSHVTGMSIHYITPAICTICIFYTMLGGIKAVIWTDFLQGMVMVASSIAVIVLGLIHVGGVLPVWERSRDGGRIRIFEMSLSPFERMTFWSTIVGLISTWLGLFSVSQGMVQKFLSLPTYSKAHKSLVFLVWGTVLIKCITCFMGLIIYATYYDCDPLDSKQISRSDQLLPHYVMDIASAIPGLPGLFMAGIFSASLSTMSSTLNSLGATLFEDFVRPCLDIKLSDRTSNNIIKLIVVIVGAVCVLMVFLVDKIGGIVQLAISTSGVSSGPLFGLFTLGMFFPRGNSKGALVGSVVSLLIMGWIVLGAQMSYADGTIKYPKLPISTDGCAFNITIPEPIATELPLEEPFILFRITFMYYLIVGFFIAIVVGMAVSLFTEAPNVEDMNPTLFTPVIRKYVLRKTQKYEMKVINGKKVIYARPPE